MPLRGYGTYPKGAHITEGCVAEALQGWMPT